MKHDHVGSNGQHITMLVVPANDIPLYASLVRADDDEKPIIDITFIGADGAPIESYEYHVDGWMAEERENADSVIAGAIHTELWGRCVGGSPNDIVVVAYTYGPPSIRHDDEHDGTWYECDVTAAISYDGAPYGIEHVGRVVMM